MTADSLYSDLLDVIQKAAKVQTKTLEDLQTTQTTDDQNTCKAHMKKLFYFSFNLILIFCILTITVNNFTANRIKIIETERQFIFLSHCKNQRVFCANKTKCSDFTAFFAHLASKTEQLKISNKHFFNNTLMWNVLFNCIFSWRCCRETGALKLCKR